MPGRKKGVTEEDQRLLNKQLLRDAEDRSAVSSLLKAWSAELDDSTEPTQDVQENQLTDDNAELDEEDFSAESDTGGMGYVKSSTISPSNGLDRQGLSSNDKLRRHLVGRNVSRSSKADQGLIAPTPRPSYQQKRARGWRNDDDNDDEEGRTSTTTSNSSDKVKGHPTAAAVQPLSKAVGQPADSTARPDAGNVTTDTKMNKKRKATSYLDEMLAKRGKGKASRGING